MIDPSSSGPARERGGVPMPQDGAPSSIDVLAAQVRDALHWDHVRRPDRAQALLALRALVARAKEAEERAEAHLLLRKEAASWAEEVEAERDALVARVTEADEREKYAWECAENMKGWAKRAEQSLATARQNASLSMGREVGWQHRAESAEAALADARNALERIADETDEFDISGEWAREVLARLDGSSE